MTDREKVIKGLECCLGKGQKRGMCEDCPYDAAGRMKCNLGDMHVDALALLKRSFTPQEIYDTVIEHGQHDKRFKLGDNIDYSFIDVIDILNMELKCKAGDM